MPTYAGGVSRSTQIRMAVIGAGSWGTTVAAIASVNTPTVLWARRDELVDQINTARVNHMIMGLQERLNITSIVVTHDMKSAFSISDRMAMVHSGQVIYSAPVEEFRRAEDARVRDFIDGRAPVQEDVQTLLNA